uniref:Uncharacterized protein n=1 Tax=Trieres chinensis TaxID=1514140 RepID=A0A7S1ZC84_TRICV|mmetsp:Transcript_22187/g.44889  ORF Transcript_22187/g.44889 Transcript_22187/m.44889 type:complete len:291 (+) Transcript_22187:84-956(+)|eukprot:CAMPEP_0183301280 /NCGR_PEP_ID=MMETSP0160_2-20130417/7448_1 /TAXON_ID=2839 ORGANISM="Odontella Sinensis, Strain Grunow 1884" /NCGR_SAMPLE_ID=MMETSP0160_2 /ASSEMBLY_ACC=CAM_ASM_000250 /LENGTH=290 /DNA_ID=CAMNT_0025463865 /DNA_START=84 /DNA_END=956 /DNA_ORIENTATION=-
MPSAALGVANVVSLGRHRYGHDPSHYPLKGLKFALKSPSLWRKILCVACGGLFVSFVVLALLLGFALVPQAKAFGNFQWWSWLLAIIAVLAEAAVVSSLVLILSQSKAQTEVFVETMRLRGRWREDVMTKPSTQKDLNLFRRAFWVRVITFPLNLVPLIGGGLYSAINATFVGWDYMDRYFDALGMDSRAQRMEVLGEDRADCSAVFSLGTYDSNNDYARFGFVCGFLESLPLVGWVLFPLTNACGTGLFACDIEAKGGPVVLRPPEQHTGITGVADAAMAKIQEHLGKN